MSSMTPHDSEEGDSAATMAQTPPPQNAAPLDQLSSAPNLTPPMTTDELTFTPAPAPAVLHDSATARTSHAGVQADIPVGPRVRPFAHLHTHSEYSFLDGLAKIEALIAKAVEDGASALALTDHGVLCGAIEFATAAAKVNANTPEFHPAVNAADEPCDSKVCAKIRAADPARDHLAQPRPFKTIMGIETYVAWGSRLDRPEKKVKKKKGDVEAVIEPAEAPVPDGDLSDLSDELAAADIGSGKADLSGSGHLVLLAKNEVGWRNLIILSSTGWMDGFYYKPRIDWELLEKHHEGIIALSSCLGGHLGKLVMAGDYAAADALVTRYQNLFGEDYYLEAQDHLDGSEEQRRLNNYVADVGTRLGIRVVATNDLHYVRRADARVEDVLLAIGTGSLVTDPNRGLKFDTPEFYLKAGWEMEDTFTQTELKAYLEASEAAAGGDEEAAKSLPQLAATLTESRERVAPMLDASVEVADKCEQLNLLSTRLHFPHFDIPAEFADNSINDEEERRVKAANDYFAHRVREKISWRWPDIASSDDRIDQIEYEIQAIQELEFAEYFLITEDIIEFAKANGMEPSPGRGSAPGSAVAYVLGITNIDPFKYKLVTGGIGFTRFLNPVVIYWMEPGVFTASPPEMPAERPSRDEMEAIVLGLLKERVSELEASGELKPDRKRLLQDEWRMIKQHGLIEPYWLLASTETVGDRNVVHSGIAWVLGITSVRPRTRKNEVGEIVSRFRPLLHFKHARKGMPDIDMDFPPGPNGRDKVIAYVREKYGHDQVCQIATYGVMKAKSAIKDVSRALGLSFDEADSLAALIPDKFQPTLEEGEEDEKDDTKVIKMMMTSKDPGIVSDSQPLRDAVNANPQIKNVVWYAAQLESTKRQVGTHPCGVLITPVPYEGNIPVMRTKTGEAQAQYDGTTVAEQGWLKEDFLGLRNLTVIGETLRLLKENLGIELTQEDIPDDDPRAMALMRKGQTLGIFQFSTSFAVGILNQIKPKSVSDLMIATALGRPGPMAQIPKYVEGAKRGHGIYPDPTFEKFAKPILEETFGVLVYQEQVMLLAIAMSGFSLPESDGLRKACAKKDEKQMAYYREKFVQGAVKNGVPGGVVSAYWDEKIAPFASYAFNRSHSAAYAMLAYRLAYLKAVYTLQFMAALTTTDRKEKGKGKGAAPAVVGEMAEARKMGLAIKPIDLNHSAADNFTIEDDNSLRMPFTIVKGVGEGPSEAIENERKRNGPFTGLDNLLARTEAARVIDEATGRLRPNPVNKTVIMALIKVGAFDELDDRMSLLTRYEAFKATASKKKQAEIDLSPTPNYVRPDIAPRDQLEWEKELVGDYITGNPALLIPQSERDRANCTVDDVLAYDKARDKEERILAAVFVNAKHAPNRNGGSRIFGTLSDGYSECSFVMFDRADNYDALVNTLESVKRQAVLLKGGFSAGKDNEGKPRAPQFIINNWKLITVRDELAAVAPTKAAKPAGVDDELYLTARAGSVSDSDFESFFEE